MEVCIETQPVESNKTPSEESNKTPSEENGEIHIESKSDESNESNESNESDESDESDEIYIKKEYIYFEIKLFRITIIKIYDYTTGTNSDGSDYWGGFGIKMFQF